MSTVAIRMTALCAGNNHATIEVVKDGGATRTVALGIADVRSAPSQDDIEAFVRVAIRLQSEGKTLAQLRTSLLAGFTVTV